MLTTWSFSESSSVGVVRRWRSSRFGTTDARHPRVALCTDPPDATIQVAIVLAGGPHRGDKRDAR